MAFVTSPPAGFGLGARSRVTEPQRAPILITASAFNGRAVLSASISRADGRCAGATAHAPSMNISTNDFRPGTTIELDGNIFRVVEFMHVKPGKGSAFVRTKLKNMRSGNQMDKTFKAGEMVMQAQLEKQVMQHTYMSGTDYVFMNMETYEEETLSPEKLGERACSYMLEGLEVEVLKHGNDILGIEIPKTMVLKVAQTDPGAKGNTVQGGTKPAVLESGATIMVPLFIVEGEKITVNTEEDKYVGRFNESK
jgi:elongation factor P